MMITRRLLATVGGAAAILALGLGCSTDSPTAPVQTPGPPPGTSPPTANWNIQVTVNPSELTINSAQPATIAVRVRRADNGQAPASGTTIVVSTSLGDFGTAGSGINSTALATAGGQASAFLFAGPIAGTALITAQLESSVGQRSVAFREPVDEVQARFSFLNTENNLSVAFQNLSTGDPTEFLWDFGDGTTSTEEHPHHVFPAIGDYVVSLTASKAGSSDTTSQLIAVGEFTELEASFTFLNSESNLSVTFINTSTGDPETFFWDFGDGGTSTEENPDHIFPRAGDYVVSLTVTRDGETASTSQIVVVGKPLDLFINFVSPTTGSPGGGTLVTISGSGFTSPLAVRFANKFGNVQSVSDTQITVLTPPADMLTETCDDNDDGTIGVRTSDTPVNVSVELQTGPTASLPNAFTYLSPTGTTCVGD